MPRSKRSFNLVFTLEKLIKTTLKRIDSTPRVLKASAAPEIIESRS